MAYRSGYRRGSHGPAPSRWMDLRYPGTCKVCGTQLPAGTRAFYDGAAKTVTCTNIECAKTDGLTKTEWYGAPTSGRWVDVLNDRRIGSPAPVPPRPGRRPSWARCEDAPCCGCC